MQLRRSRLATCTFTLVLVVFGALPSLAQLTDLKEPTSSPLWWTLSVEISPAQLKGVHADVEAHRERFRQAVAGHMTSEGYPGETDDIRFFISGGQTPELFPLWIAFDSYASHVAADAEVRSAMAPVLEGLGISPETAAQIDLVALRYLADLESRLLVVQQDSKEFWKIVNEAKERLGPDAVQEKLKTRDYRGLAMATDSEIVRTQHLMESVNSSPLSKTVEPRLRELKESLSDEDWRRFRRFLLLKVAPGMSIKLRTSDL